MNKKEEYLETFRRIGVINPQQWAEAEVQEGLGNIPKAMFLHQAWSNIPKENDITWLETWMASARRAGESDVLAALERMINAGTSKNDIVLVIKEMMARLLYDISYLVDDPSIEDEELEHIAWGLYEENEDMEPIRRMGCVHELVYDLDPDKKV